MDSIVKDSIGKKSFHSTTIDDRTHCTANDTQFSCSNDRQIIWYSYSHIQSGIHYAWFSSYIFIDTVILYNICDYFTPPPISVLTNYDLFI